MTRGARVYLRNGVWIVGPLSPTRTGPFVATQPYVELPPSTTYRELAEEVRVALSHSQVIPDIDFRDPNRKNKLSPILKAAGVRSWTALQKGAKLVSLRATDEEILLSPSVNEGGRNGFSPLAEATITLPATSTLEELSEALRQAFVACR